MINLVVLGDSIATTDGCAGCTGFPDLYGRALERRTKSTVHVANLAVPDTGVTDLVGQLSNDEVTREALADADIVVVTTGFNDMGPGGRPLPGRARLSSRRLNEITDDCIASAVKDNGIGLNAALDTVDDMTSGNAAPKSSVSTTSSSGTTSTRRGTHPRLSNIHQGEQTLWWHRRRRNHTRHGVYVDMLTRMNGLRGQLEARKYLADDYTHLNQRSHALAARALRLRFGSPSSQPRRGLRPILQA